MSRILADQVKAYVGLLDAEDCGGHSRRRPSARVAGRQVPPALMRRAGPGPCHASCNAARLGACNATGLHTSRHVHFANSILADNIATDGEECFTTNTGVVSFLASYWTFLSPSCNTDQGPGWHTNPSPGLDPLGFNGSTIQAHCPPAGSPVVDTANTNPLVGVVATFVDQYGNGWAGVPLALPDIGACERQ